MLIISWIYQFSSIHSSIHRAHVKKVGHTSEYLFAIYWWTWKAAINLKNCWNIPIKNERFLIFKMLLSFFFFCFFFEKLKKNTWIYYYFTPVYKQPWWYDIRFLRYRVWQTETGNYGTFLIFCMVPEIWNRTDRIFSHFRLFFCSFNSLTTRKLKILKKWKKLLDISQLYHKCQS